MKRATLNDLTDLTMILEDFHALKDKMSDADLIDLAARLKPAAKAIETIDEFVKDKVKAKLHHKEGTLNGIQFRAVLKLVPMPRFQQTVFREERPRIYEAYIRNDTDERVSFETR